MKRVQVDEIQKLIENYMKRRNYIHGNNSLMNNDKSIDTSTMAFRDLTLFESTINNYYLFSSMYSMSSDDYYKQYCKYKIY